MIKYYIVLWYLFYLHIFLYVSRDENPVYDIEFLYLSYDTISI